MVAPTLEILLPGTDHNEAEADIIFVHGLNPLSHTGHAVKTWTHADGTFWPRALLPEHIPTARVMLFAYNSNVAWDAPEAGIRQHANDLLDLVNERRQEVPCVRPIVFICHSLGGLVVKQALLTAHLNRRFESIRRAIYGVVFFATPHRGGNGATIGQVAANVARTVTGSDRNDLVKSLQKNSPFLAHLTADFKHISEDYSYLSIVESRGIFRAPFRTVVVDRKSAELGFPGHREHVIELDLDHRQICKLTKDAVSERILRHLKRLVNSATREATDNQSGIQLENQTDIQVQIYDQEHSTHNNKMSVAASPRLFSTIESIERVTNIGFDALITQLTQWVSDDFPILVLHGSPGSGKTSVASEFAWKQRSSQSIFWFAAENTHNLQNSCMRASRCVDPDGSSEDAGDHYRVVTQWLLDPKNGRWILIFDNASAELNFREILPKTVPWGKILFTSRTGNIVLGTRQASEKLVSVSMPPLSADNAIALFNLGCTNTGLTPAQRSEVSKLSTQLRRNPYSILLASAYFKMFRDIPAVQFSDQDALDGADNFSLRLISFLVEEAGMNRRLYLIFLFLLGGGTTPLEVVSLCQSALKRRRDLQRETDFLSISNTGPTINHWTSIGLLQRQNNPSGTVLSLRSSAVMALEKELVKDPEQTAYILELCLRLLALGMEDIGSLSSKSIAKYVERTIGSLRNLCVVARDVSFSLPRESVSHLQVSRFYHLDKTVSEGRLLFKKMFWRQWLSSNNYPPPPYLTKENEFTTGAPVIPLPPWLENGLQGNDPQSDGFKNMVQDEMVAKLRDELQRATWLCAIGNTWFGVRAYIFEFARQNFHADYSESQKASFIDFVDKGGTEGVQTKVVSFTRTQEWREEVEGKISFGAVEEIAQVICAISYPYVPLLSEPVIRKAVSEALENTMQETFSEAGSVFATSLLPIQDLITDIITGPLEIPSDGASVQQLVQFGVIEVGGQYLEERCLALADGFCENLYAAKIWIAARVCLYLACAAADANTSARREVDWNWISAIIELTREGVCPLERVPGRKVEVAGRKMLHWLEEACRCRNAWGALADVPGYEFRNQALWEETRILMGAEYDSWILS